MGRTSSSHGRGPQIPSKLHTHSGKLRSSKQRDLKGKGKADMNVDIYNYEPESMRRSNIKLALDDEELQGAGYGSEGDSSGEGPSRREPRLIDDEGGLDSDDDDDEIDSDEAFGESDEERFAGYSFKRKATGTKAKKVRKVVPKLEVDLDEEEDANMDASFSRGDERERDQSDSGEEDEEEEESGDDEEFYDVLDILDGRAKVDDEGGDTTSNAEPLDEAKNARSGRGVLSAVESESRDEGEDDQDDQDSSEESEGSNEELNISGSEDESDEDALKNLHNLVNGLETGLKRKEPEKSGAVDEPITKRRKRTIKDVTESGVENEFGGNVADGSKLSLDDLLVPLSSRTTGFESLKKAINPLSSTSRKNQTLAAPLPTRTQEKLDREAAYEQTKQEVDKWSSTMRRIQEAEHLSFPLQAPETVKASNLELTAKFKPVTELESSIDRLLKQAKLRDEDLNKTEDLMMKDLTVEEVAERRAELRKMRELAFRADQKAKRVAKIKSKAYRRIHKKEKTKLLAKLDASGERTEADLEEERLKAEVLRARERATLRHKNTGKWAKAMNNRAELDVDQRRDITEMLEKGEQLRRRIQGVDSDSENDEHSIGSAADDDEIRIREDAFRELKAVQNAEEPIDSIKAKSVFQMKFMKDAADRQNATLDREIDDLRQEMGRIGSDDESGSENDSAHPQKLNGRLVFQPGPQVAGLMLPPPPPSAISETSTLRSHDSHIMSPTDEQQKGNSPPISALSLDSASVEIMEKSGNPWLIESAEPTKIARRKNELISGKNLSRVQKSEFQMHKHLTKGREAREMALDDATLELDSGDILLLNTSVKSVSDPTVAGKEVTATLSKKQRKMEAKKAKKQRSKQQQHSKVLTHDEVDSEADTNSEVDAQEAVLRNGKRATTFQQRDLVARAFAGDNVLQQFEEEKLKEMEADAPNEIDTTLSGWGAWGGAGTKKAPLKPHLLKKVAGIDPKARADYNKAHVIISEKRDKKALKYAVKDLPYPYTSKAQFEASMSTPIGNEWNTRLGFQRGTLPRVVKKMGTIIDPLEKI